jgi:hypothetical protein
MGDVYGISAECADRGRRHGRVTQRRRLKAGSLADLQKPSLPKTRQTAWRVGAQ